MFLNNISIPQCISIKYLGLTVDMNLNFDFHISNIAYKISRTVGIISKIRHYLPETALLKNLLRSDIFPFIIRPYYLGIYLPDVF